MPVILPTIGPCAGSCFAGRVQRGGVQSAGRIPFVRAARRDAVPTTISPRVPPVVSSRRISGMPASGGSMSMPASSIILGMEPRVAMPMPPHAVQSMTMPRVCGRVVRKLEVYLAKQIVGGAVVGLAAVAEAAGNRAERHRRAQRHVADGVQQIEPAVRLDVEDQVELALVFVGQEVAALQSGGVQQHVDAAAALAHLLDDLGDAVRVREVDAEVVRRPACGAHRVDCASAPPAPVPELPALSPPAPAWPARRAPECAQTDRASGRLCR